ncbi:hypothetical protein J437_LFUL011993 [Ladona fulva]|uniref:Uncharacterized protein n=1 Tax=Ladona fulva TaxID=123851 RepID=A0A8K0KKP8_LADFU|nr:hypothetical protein J437_LFUL011993 [Ladona fulva]
MGLRQYGSENHGTSRVRICSDQGIILPYVRLELDKFLGHFVICTLGKNSKDCPTSFIHLDPLPQRKPTSTGTLSRKILIIIGQMVLMIPMTIIKQASYWIASPISSIFNSSMSEGHFPSILKLAHVTPVHKKGSYTNSINYHPISILSVFSKILEKLFLT